MATTPPVPGDLQEVFTTLARRAKLPTRSEATPATVLRAAGLPLLMASLVTGGHAAVADAGAAAAPVTAADAWTVTSLAVPGGEQAASRGESRTAPPPPGTPAPAGTAPGNAGSGAPGQGGSTGSWTSSAPSESSGPSAAEQGPPRVTYTVRPGDTLQKIADLSGRSLPAIVEMNQLKPGSDVEPGQVLILPPPASASAGAKVGGAPTPPAPDQQSSSPSQPSADGKPAGSDAGAPVPAAAPTREPAAAPTAAPGQAPPPGTATSDGKTPIPTHTVTVTVTVPSTPTGATAATPMQAAPGSPAGAQPAKAAAPGKTVPATTAPAKAATPPNTPPAKALPVAPPAPATYTVRRGDTVIDIARRHGRSAAGIMRLNKISPDGLIHPGDVLTLPPLPGTTPPQAKPAAPAKAAAPPTKAAAPAKAATPPVKAPATPAKKAAAVPAKAAPAKTVPPAKAAPAKAAPAKTVPPAKAAPAKAAPAKAAPAKAAPAKAAPAKAAPAKAAPAKAAPAKKAAPAPAAPTTRPYTVKDGDTLIGICAGEKVDLEKVLTLNHLHRDAVIHPGQKLLLPAPPPKTSNNTFLGRTYPPAVVAAADANRKALAKKSVPSRERVKVLITATAKQQGVDPALALAIAYQESGFNQRAVSPANAVGVMQVIPSAGKWASSIIGKPLDLLDTEDNITAGVVLLGTLSKAADTEPQAIAGYYQGLASVRKNGMYDDTRRYVANIQTLRSRFAKTL